MNIAEQFYPQNLCVKRGIKAKSMGLSKVKLIVEDLIGVDSIVFDPSVAKIFYFKHDFGATNVVNFIGFYWQPCR